MKITRTFGNAIRGIYNAVKAERNLKIHTVSALVAVMLGCYLQLSAHDWMYVIFAIGIVLAAEMFNTAIERLADMVKEGRDSRIGYIKDVAAGAVLFTAVMALTVGIVIILIPLVKQIG